ncbi:MAG: hypothetical protein ISR96_10175 [Nitrospira sp.]|nr:hypothetical protein [bacterium]MBL7049867.1 hypothetical protein [Nitrospira sp.]
MLKDEYLKYIEESGFREIEILYVISVHLDYWIISTVVRSISEKARGFQLRSRVLKSEASKKNNHFASLKIYNQGIKRAGQYLCPVRFSEGR